MFKKFSLLPIELQNTILHEADVQTIGRFCKTNKHIYSFVKAERFWENKFRSLIGKRKCKFVPLFLELGSTWLERVKVIWRMLHPKSIYTLLIQEWDDECGFISFEEARVVCNFTANDMQHAHERIFTFFMDAIEPVFYAINKAIRRHRKIKHIKTVDDLKALFIDSEDYEFTITKNMYFEIDDTSLKTCTLVTTDSDDKIFKSWYNTDGLLTIRTINQDKINLYLASMMFLFENELWSERNGEQLVVGPSDHYKRTHPNVLYRINQELKGIFIDEDDYSTRLTVDYMLTQKYVVNQFAYAAKMNVGDKVKFRDSLHIQKILNTLVPDPRNREELIYEIFESRIIS